MYMYMYMYVYIYTPIHNNHNNHNDHTNNHNSNDITMLLRGRPPCAVCVYIYWSCMCDLYMCIHRYTYTHR